MVLLAVSDTVLNKALRQYKKIISVAVAFLIITFSPISLAEDSAQINLRDVEIPTLIETVSRITGKSFVVDPRVKGRVTVITSSDIDADELYETFLSILQVHGFSAVPSGANLIKIVPSNQAKQQPVPVIGEEEEKAARIATKARKSGKRDKNGKKYKKPKKRNADELITRVIRVEHVPAAMLVPILRPLVPSTGQLQAYGPSNTIVISDRAANIDRLIKIIKRMDRADDEELEVVPLKYASAKQLAQTITILQRSSIKGAASKNRVAADVRTNSLLLSGDKSSRQQVRKIIRKLDTYQRTEERTKVVYLRYAKATDLAKVLTGFSKTQKTTKATKKGAAGTQKADIDIQADDSTNSLIITAEPDVQKNLAKVIRKLDVRRAQVLVEAIIAEISADLSKNIGVQLGTGAADNGKNVGFGILSQFSSAGASFSAKGVPIPAKDGGTFGFALGHAGQVNFGLLLNALSGDAATNILSTPTIIALDNEEAKIVVGKNVPFLTGQFTGSGGSTTPSNPFQTIERKDVGLTLKIKPQINDGSSIRLDIEQEISSLSASDVSTTDVVTNKRTINTSVMVEDGQVLVLGGLIEDTYTDTEQKVPVLGDIPIIGRAFRNNKTIKKKQNLMVFIHPVIMRDVLSGDEYTRQKYNKLKYAQSISNIANRGLLKNGASVFPENIRRDLVKKLTPAQKKQIIIREQKQRVLAHQRKIRQARLNQQQANRMAQQRRAAGAQARTRTPLKTRPVTPQRRQAIKSMPQRLRNIVPHTKAKQPVSRFGDVFDMDTSN